MVDKLTKKGIEEIKGFISSTKKKFAVPRNKKVRISHSGKQYFIRIPMDFCDEMSIDVDKHFFEFKIEKDENSELVLTGKLVSAENEK